MGVRTNSAACSNRIPTHGVEHGTAIANDYSIPAYQTVNNGGKVAILALGGFLELGKETVKAFRKKKESKQR